MPRFTATEMVGVTFSTLEVRRLLNAIAEGKLGTPEGAENVALQEKLTVLLQVSAAREKREAQR